MSLSQLFSTRERRSLIFTASLAFFAMGSSQAMYGPFYPHFRGMFGISGSVVGLMASFHFIGATLAVLIAGLIVRWTGFRAVLVTGASVFAGGFFLTALGVNWPVILLGTWLLGTGFGIMVTFNLLVDDYFGPLGPAALNLINLFFGVGSILGPVLAGVSLGFGTHRIAFVAGGVIATVVVLLNTRLLTHTPAAETDRSRLGFAVAGTGAFLLFFAIYVGAEASAANWIPTSLVATHSGVIATSTMALFWLALSTGRAAAVLLSVRVSPPTMAIGAVTGAAVLMTLARLELIAPAAYILTGFFLGPVFPAAVSWIRRVFPTRAAQISAVVLAGAGLGGVFFPPLVGLSVDHISTAVIPLVIAGVLGLAAVTGTTIRRFFPTPMDRPTDDPTS